MLTLETAARVRELLAAGRPRHVVADRLGVSRTTVRRIATGEWRHETLPPYEPTPAEIQDGCAVVQRFRRLRAGRRLCLTGRRVTLPRIVWDEPDSQELETD